MTTSIQPGWYDNPEDSNEQRYWDGQAWTPHRQRKGVAPPPPPVAAVAPPPPPNQPIQPGWYDNPEDSNEQRYWDGQAWTPHRQRKGVAPPPPPVAAVAPPPPPNQQAPWLAPGQQPAGPPPQQSNKRDKRGRIAEVLGEVIGETLGELL